MIRKVNRFNGAVHECLEECYQATLPVACLAEYAQRLRADGWREAEIEEIETVVRRLLKAVVAPEDSDQPSVPPQANAS
jgi:hypothetical protein